MLVADVPEILIAEETEKIISELDHLVSSYTPYLSISLECRPHDMLIATILPLLSSPSFSKHFLFSSFSKHFLSLISLSAHSHCIQQERVGYINIDVLKSLRPKLNITTRILMTLTWLFAKLIFLKESILWKIYIICTKASLTPTYQTIRDRPQETWVSHDSSFVHAQ